MKIMKYNLLILLSAMVLVGCNYAEIPTYSGYEYVQIVKENNNKQQQRAMNFAYTELDAMHDTIWVNLFISGPTKDYDREVCFEQKQEYEMQMRRDDKGNIIDSVLVKVENQAVPNVDYVPFNDPEIKRKMIIPAHAYGNLVPIVLKRTEAIKTPENTKRLFFRIVDSKDFKPGDRVTIGATVKIMDYLTPPKYWKEIYLGKYSTVLHKLYIDVTSEKWDDEFIDAIEKNPLKDAIYIQYKNTVKKELMRINEENGYPMLSDPNDPKSIITIP